MSPTSASSKEFSWIGALGLAAVFHHDVENLKCRRREPSSRRLALPQSGAQSRHPRGASKVNEGRPQSPHVSSSVLSLRTSLAAQRRSGSVHSSHGRTSARSSDGLLQVQERRLLVVDQAEALPCIVWITWTSYPTTRDLFQLAASWLSSSAFGCSTILGGFLLTMNSSWIPRFWKKQVEPQQH